MGIRGGLPLGGHLPVLLLAWVLAAVRAHPVPLSAKVVEASTRLISMVDLGKEVCAEDCLENCLDENNMRRAGCFNTGVFESRSTVVAKDEDGDVTVSDDPNDQSTPVSGDVIASVISSIGAPSVVIGYAQDASVYDLSPAASSLTQKNNFWIKAISNNFEARTGSAQDEWDIDMLTFGPKEMLGSRLFTMGLAVQELIEYHEQNDDGVFTPGVDQVLNSVDLWDKQYMELESKMSDIDGADYKLYSFNITSVDKLVSFKFSTTPKLDTDDKTFHHQLRTPNGTRVTMRVKDFPFEGHQSRLAIKMVLITPDRWSAAPMSARAKPGVVRLVDKSTMKMRGFFTWTTTVAAKSTAGPFKNREGLREAAVKVSTMEEADWMDISYSLAKSQMAISERSKAYITYASCVGSTFNPSELWWDFSIGYGQTPKSQVDSTALIAAGSQTPHRVADMPMVVGITIAVIFLSLVACVCVNSTSDRLAFFNLQAETRGDSMFGTYDKTIKRNGDSGGAELGNAGDSLVPFVDEPAIGQLVMEGVEPPQVFGIPTSKITAAHNYMRNGSSATQRPNAAAGTNI